LDEDNDDTSKSPASMPAAAQDVRPMKRTQAVKTVEKKPPAPQKVRSVQRTKTPKTPPKSNVITLDSDEDDEIPATPREIRPVLRTRSAKAPSISNVISLDSDDETSEASDADGEYHDSDDESEYLE
jgi:hypothetical protein